MEMYEMSVLEVISKYDEISQRDISNKVGISLGMVNLLIHKFVKVGLVKVENLNGKKVRYILTPSGFTVLTKKTVDYISRSYAAILKVKAHMDDVLQTHYSDGETVLIYGAHDEVYDVLLEVLKNRDINYKTIDYYEEVDKFVHWEVEIQQGIFLLGGVEH